MPAISISLNGILKLLSNLKTDKAAGPDNIKPVVLKELRCQIAPILQIRLQKSIDSGTLPSDWTKGNVAPLYKNGPQSDPSNYRPITLTCILCKLTEHIIASNISAHFTRYNILYDLQHGFRERRSCETQLIQLVDDLARTLVAGQQSDLILLDFSKAFDKVSHSKLLYKLHEHGIRGCTLDWIRSFLIGRTQVVVLEGEKSDEVPVTSGVPQGSVLGPLLFLLYINNLPDHVKSQVRLFADDTAVYLTINNLNDCNTLQQDLNTLEQWEIKWEMRFNPSKCQVLNITRNKHKIKQNYILHGHILETLTRAKY